MIDTLKITLILLATAVCVVVLFRRLNLPAILGYTFFAYRVFRGKATALSYG